MATYEAALTQAAAEMTAPVNYGAMSISIDSPYWSLRHLSGTENQFFVNYDLTSTNMPDAIVEAEVYLTNSIGLVKVTEWNNPVGNAYLATSVWVNLPF